MPPPTNGAFDDVRPSAVQDPTLPRTRGRAIVGALVVLLAVVTLLALLFLPIPEGVERPIEILVGVNSACLFSVVQFYFGSSAGSADKNEILLLALRRGERA